MKLTAPVLLSISLIGLLFLTAKVEAASSASVAATVTAQNISVTVSDGTIAYGIIPVNTSKSTIAADLNDLQTATNNGNVAEDLNIKGQDTAAWTLGGTAGSETYVHQFCTATCTTPPTNFNALTTNYQTLATNIATSGTQTFDLRITTPTSTATFTSQSADVTVQAVAH